MFTSTFNKMKSHLPNIELKRNPNEISTAAKTLKNFPIDYVKDKYMKQPYLNRSILETNMVNDDSKLKALEYFSKDDKEQLEKLKNFGYVINKSNEIKEKGINATNNYVRFTRDNNASELKNDWHSEYGGKKNRRTKKRRNKRKNTRRKKCKNGMSRII